MNNEALEALNKFFILIILLDIINAFSWILNINLRCLTKEIY